MTVGAYLLVGRPWISAIPGTRHTPLIAAAAAGHATRSPHRSTFRYLVFLHGTTLYHFFCPAGVLVLRRHLYHHVRASHRVGSRQFGTVWLVICAFPFGWEGVPWSGNSVLSGFFIQRVGIFSARVVEFLSSWWFSSSFHLFGYMDFSALSFFLHGISIFLR